MYVKVMSIFVTVFTIKRPKGARARGLLMVNKYTLKKCRTYFAIDNARRPNQVS